MAPSPAQDDELESLLSADDEPAKPEPEEAPVKEPEPEAKAEAEAPAEGAGKSEIKPPAEKPKPTARLAAAPAPQRDSGWMVWALIALLLLMTVIGVCWYANQQRMHVKDLKDQLETAKTQATGIQATAGSVADDLAPLVEEQLAIAKVREAAGDAEGAKYALLLAKRYAEMADKLSGQTPSGKLQGLTAQIEETEKAVGGAAATTPAAEPTTAAPEPAATAEQPATKAGEATPGAAAAAPAAPAAAGTAPAATSETPAPAASAAPQSGAAEGKAGAEEGKAVPPGG